MTGPCAWAQPFRLPISCPQCAGPVHLVNGTTNGLLSIAVVRCEHLACGRQWEITVRINRMAVSDAERNEEQRERERAAA